MIIIGIMGGIGHGKSTLAKFLDSQASPNAHWESSDIICEVANGLRASSESTPEPGNVDAINHWLTALPAIVATVTHTEINTPITLTQGDIDDQTESYAKLFEYLTIVNADPNLTVGPITPSNKPALRSLLQWLGGYLAKQVRDDIWFGEILRRIETVPNLQLATVGGVRFPADAASIRAAGGHIVNIIRPQLAEADALDITERERSSIQADVVVYNDAGLDELAACAGQVYQAIANGTALPEYYASSFVLPDHR